MPKRSGKPPADPNLAATSILAQVQVKRLNFLQEGREPTAGAGAELHVLQFSAANIDN